MRSQISATTDGVSEMAKQFDNIKGKVSSLISEAQKLTGFKASDLYNPDQFKASGLSGDSRK